MAEQLSMDDILDDKKPAEPAAPAPAPEKAAEPALESPKLDDKPPPEAPKVERPLSRKKQWQDREQDAQGRVRDPDTGQYVAKEEKKAETAPTKEPPAEPAKPEPAKPAVAAPQQEFTDKEKAFQRAMLEERGKRQELERRLAAIEAAKGAAPAEAPKTFWDDPEAALAKHRAEIRTEATNARLQTSEFIARQKHQDFDEKVATFEKILQQTPGLAQQWLASPDPAEFAFTTGKNHLELEQAGSIDQLRAKIEKETEARVRLKLEAELKEKAEVLARERAALPPSLSDARSTGANKHVWGGVPSMDDILKG